MDPAMMEGRLFICLLLMAPGMVRRAITMIIPTTLIRTTTLKATIANSISRRLETGRPMAWAYCGSKLKSKSSL